MDQVTVGPNAYSSSVTWEELVMATSYVSGKLCQDSSRLGMTEHSCSLCGFVGQ